MSQDRSSNDSQSHNIAATDERHTGRLWGMSLSTLIAALITVLSWSSAFVGIRAGLEAYSPTHVALFRYIITSIVLAVYMALTGRRLPAWRDWPGIAVTGLFGITYYNLALNYGQVVVPSATASFLIASAPVWLALLASFIFRERLQIWGWIGIGISMAGVAVIALGNAGQLSFAPRALVVLSAAFATSIYSLGQKKYVAEYGALSCTAYAIWAGTLFLLPFGGGLFSETLAAPFSATAAVIYIGLVPGAIGYVTWSYVLGQVPAARAGSFLYLVPALALLVAWLWLGEVPSGVSVIGGILVLAGVIVVNRLGKVQQASRNA